jgi:hypothetical protein
MTTARVMLRPIGNPLPLGFLALAAGTLLVAGLQLGWLAPSEGHDVALILIAFVAPLQLLASVFGYLAATWWPAPRWACWPGRGCRWDW